MFRRVGVFGLFLLVGGCGSQPTPTPTPTPTATDIPPSVSGPLSANFAALAQSSSGQAALAAQGAALALQAGVQAIPVTLTASVVAAPPAGSRSSALNSNGPGSAFAFQVTVINTANGSPHSGVYSGVVAYVDASDAAEGMGTSPNSTKGDFAAGTAVGSIFLGGDTEIWHATQGQESAQLVMPGANCNLSALPTHVTACTKGTFSAGLNIMASTSTVVGDTSSKPALMPSTNTVPGVVLTVDYTQVSETIMVSPSSATVAPGGTVYFEAYVTGTGVAPTWTVTGGMVSYMMASEVMYTAPSTGGTYTVTATLPDGQFSTATVTVQ